MTIRSLSRFVLVGVLLASFNASAIPGFWQQGYQAFWSVDKIDLR